MDFLTLWQALIALGFAAIVLEFLVPAFIFASLAVTLWVIAGLSFLALVTVPTMLLIGAVLWVAISLGLRSVFGSWGKSDAVEDPNQYEREKDVR